MENIIYIKHKRIPECRLANHGHFRCRVHCVVSGPKFIRLFFADTESFICSSGHGAQLQTSFSASSTQLPTSRNTKVGYNGHYITTFTGWMLLSGFSSEWLQQFTSVCTAWLQRTSLNCVRLSLRQRVVVVGFGPPQPAIWSYHAADCQPTAPVPLVSISFDCFMQQSKHFYFADIDNY